MELANPFQPAIDALEKKLAEVERQGNALLMTINHLRSEAGQPPRPSGFMGEGKNGTEDTSAALTHIQHDTFFSKKMSSSAREYLEMRKAAKLGPARVREIFEALQQGGYQFETKDDETAQNSLRSMMSKYTVMFQKLPNSTWGLKSWYPDAKKPRSTAAKLDAAATVGEEDPASEDDNVVPMPDESAPHADAA
jgi:hypothetical protein